MSTATKYWEKYKEKNRSESNEKSQLNKVMTDKQAYISYLELQLEKVTESILLTQTISERLDLFQSQISATDEKLASLTKLVKLQQTYAEKQDEDLNTVKTCLESGIESKQSQNLAALQALERRVKVIEDQSEFPKHKSSGFESFAKEIDSAIKVSELKFSGLLSKAVEDLENKQKKVQKTLEGNFEAKFEELTEQWQETSRKVERIQELNKFDLKKEEKSVTVKVDSIESALKDLEHFLVAIADEVKKLENNQQVLSESENRLSKSFNARLQKLSDMVQATMAPGSYEFSPKKFVSDKEFELKESPKFPATESEDPKKRSKSKESLGGRSKSPSSHRNKSKDSFELNRTPKSSNASVKTPTKQSFSPSSKKLEPKSKQVEASIKEKLKKIKGSSPVSKKTEEKKPKKKPEKKSKLDKLYQELSTKS